MVFPQCLTGERAAAKSFLDSFDVSKIEHLARRAIWYFSHNCNYRPFCWIAMVVLSLQHLNSPSWLILHRSTLVGKQNPARSRRNNRVSKIEGYVLVIWSSLLSIMKPLQGREVYLCRATFLIATRKASYFRHQQLDKITLRTQTTFSQNGNSVQSRPNLHLSLQYGNIPLADIEAAFPSKQGVCFGRKGN